CARSPPMADGPWAPSPFATSDGRRMLDWRTDMGAPLLAQADIVVIVLDRGRHGTTACRATVGTGVTTLGECLAGVVALVHQQVAGTALEVGEGLGDPRLDGIARLLAGTLHRFFGHGLGKGGLLR